MCAHMSRATGGPGQKAARWSLSSGHNSKCSQGRTGVFPEALTACSSLACVLMLNAHYVIKTKQISKIWISDSSMNSKNKHYISFQFGPEKKRGGETVENVCPILNEKNKNYF